MTESPLTIFAAGSLSPARMAIRDGFQRVVPDVEIRFHPPDHSGLLARQIAEGGAADDFISANWDYLHDLQRAGLVPEPRVLAGNRLCPIVRPEIAPLVTGIADLAQDGIRLLLPPLENDPLAQYTALLFERAGLSAAIAAKRQRGEIRDDLAAFRELIEQGQIDAMVMYASMAPSFEP